MIRRRGGESDADVAGVPCCRGGGCTTRRGAQAWAAVLEDASKSKEKIDKDRAQESGTPFWGGEMLGLSGAGRLECDFPPHLSQRGQSRAPKEGTRLSQLFLEE